MAHGKTSKMGSMVGNLAIIAIRRAMMELRRTENLKESLRKWNMIMGEVIRLLMHGASDTVRAKNTRRLVNAIVKVIPQTNGHHQGKEVPKALRAALKALKAL